MMKRKIVNIDREKCDGCGLCVNACHEGAIELVGGKARLKGDEYCDGLGDCLPECPRGAIDIIERESRSYKGNVSELGQWPVQLKLVNPRAPYLKNAELLIAADCTSYAYGNFHRDFIKGHIVLIGCPKLDDIDYYEEKFTDIIKNNNLKSITVVRMEVPCCGGIVNAVKNSMLNSGMMVPYREVVISIEGNIIEDKN